MLYQIITASDMRNDLVSLDRDYYSIEALENYVDMIEDLGTNVQWDPIGFCVEFDEFGDYDCLLTFRNLLDSYGYIADQSYEEWLEEENLLDTDENLEQYIDEVLLPLLEDETMVWKLENGNIMLQVF